MTRPRRPRGQEPVKMLVVGVGHLGRLHARVYNELDGVSLVGVVDKDAQRAKEVGSKLGVPFHTRLTSELLAEAHGASVATSTPAHYDVALQCMEAGVSVLVEKPMTSTLAQARQLLDFSRKQGVTVQVGHIERFNPVVLAAYPHIKDPVFIECDRIHPFSFRSVETSVVLDLMIHDIDIVLNLVNRPVTDLDAVGAQVLSETDDLANARITFKNGCTAIVKASRVAIQKSRKMRIFCRDSYLTLDYIAKTGMRIALKEGFDRKSIDWKEMAEREKKEGPYAFPVFAQYLSIEQLPIPTDEPLKNELEAFALAVRTGRTPVVTGEHGYQAIEIAVRIQETIRERQERFLMQENGEEAGGE